MYLSDKKKHGIFFFAVNEITVLVYLHPLLWCMVDCHCCSKWKYAWKYAYLLNNRGYLISKYLKLNHVFMCTVNGLCIIFLNLTLDVNVTTTSICLCLI